MAVLNAYRKRQVSNDGFHVTVVELYAHYELNRPSRPPTLLQTMGFLKRLLSIGSKKHKKKTPAHEGDSNQLRRHHTQTLPLVSEDAEVAASRLLRSASARFAVVSESDYNPLPPLRACL
jgi:hypothetical protein